MRVCNRCFDQGSRKAGRSIHIIDIGCYCDFAIAFGDPTPGRTAGSNVSSSQVTGVLKKSPKGSEFIQTAGSNVSSSQVTDGRKPVGTGLIIRYVVALEGVAVDGPPEVLEGYRWWRLSRCDLWAKACLADLTNENVVKTAAIGGVPCRLKTMGV